MIVPNRLPDVTAVAAHYDELDPFYREVWGQHVHHGYWASGRESPTEATAALVALVAERLELESGQEVCDIGCGYGATARLLAGQHQVRVTGVTVSAVQAAQAEPMPGVRILVRDWLANGLADASFDRAYAIESSEHMADKQGFFAEAMRTLRPGGRLVVCAWIAADAPAPWQVRHLLEPICREGRLPGMGDEADYRRLAEAAGLEVVAVEDLSARVARTWSICARRVAWSLLTRPRYLRHLLSPAASDRVFVLTLPRLILAYRSRAMRYLLLVCKKPGEGASPKAPVLPPG